MPIVIAWNSDPTIPVSYYWNNEASSLCMDKAALAEDDKSSTNYQSCLCDAIIIIVLAWYIPLLYYFYI